MTKRTSKKVVSAISADQFNDHLALFAKADTREEIITAKMDAEMIKIRDKYREELDEMAAQKSESLEVIETYCHENMDTIFGKNKSVETTHGVVGFRTGTPKLKLLKGFNWAKVLDNLKAYLPGYVRVIEEPAKDRLLVDRETKAVASNMHKLGIMIDQDEQFFIKLKKEEPAA